MKKLLNIPNILTISRVVLLPFFMLSFFVDSQLGKIAGLTIFIFCCITDFLDGYYARTYRQTTKFGQMLDPLADKILISIAILCIAGFQKISHISMIPAAIILSREIIISGVRDATTKSKREFSTSKLSKWKTASQMLAITLILSDEIFDISKAGEFLLWISATLAIISGVFYYKQHNRNLF